MSGYPNAPYGYGAPPSQPYAYGGQPPPQPYGSAPPPQGHQPYGSPPPSQGHPPYGAPPPPQGHQPYGSPPQPQGHHQPYGAPPPSSAPYAPSAPYASAPGETPPTDNKPQPHGGSAAPHITGYPPSPLPYGGPFALMAPSSFPPGTDPNVIACFQLADQDGSGFIDDKELQRVLSSYNQSFGLRTVHLLMYLFTNSNIRKIGPKEFTAVFYSLQSWRAIFERFDRDRSGKIDSTELRDALLSLGFAVPPTVLDLLVSKFNKSGGKNKAIEYDNFIECCLTVKGLTEKFKEKDTKYSGSATFTYENFMLTVLPFLIA